METESAVKAIAGADAVAAIAAGRAGYLPPVAAGLVFAPTVAGVAALRGNGTPE